MVLGGESSEQKELEIELEVFTSILTDFHHVCFHWVVHPSQISLTSNCQVPSKRPLTIVPELLPGERKNYPNSRCFQLKLKIA